METYHFKYFLFVSDEIVWFFSALSDSVHTIIGSILSLWNFLLQRVALFFISKSHLLFPLTFVSSIPLCPLVTWSLMILIWLELSKSEIHILALRSGRIFCLYIFNITAFTVFSQNSCFFISSLWNSILLTACITGLFTACSLACVSSLIFLLILRKTSTPTRNLSALTAVILGD